MSVLHTNQNSDQYNDIIANMFGGSASTTKSSSTSSTNSAVSSANLFDTVKTNTTLLSTFGNAKSPPTPSSGSYQSKYDQMEEGRMSTKVIRTQLVKNDKRVANQVKDDQREKLRLQALLGEQAKNKLKLRRTQLDSSDDSDDDSKVRSKTAMIRSKTSFSSTSAASHSSFGKKLTTGEVLQEQEKVAMKKQQDVRDKNQQRAVKRKENAHQKEHNNEVKLQSTQSQLSHDSQEHQKKKQKTKKIQQGEENNKFVQLEMCGKKSLH